MAEDTAVIDAPKASAQEAMTAVQRAFDIATQDKHPRKPKPVEPKPPEPPKPTASEPIPAPATPVTTPEPQAPVEPTTDKFKLPSFIATETEVEKAPEKATEPEIKLADLPVEPPATASENEKINWKKTRTLLEKQEKEIKELREKQVSKQDLGKELTKADNDRLQQLEEELGQAKSQLQRYGLENDQSFISEVLQPMQTSYQEARRIIREAGGSEALLDKALSLQGKEHYTAMDEILSELPESAKGELTSTMRDFRKYATKRAQEIANAPKAFQERQKREVTEQRNFMESQKQDMEKLFDARVKNLRETYKFEPLIESQDEDTKWWNNIPKNVVEKARRVVFDNQDVGVAMDVAIMGVSAPTLRDLWLSSEKRANALEKELRAIRGSEPTISSTKQVPLPDDKELTKMPFDKAFLSVLKKQAGH